MVKRKKLKHWKETYQELKKHYNWFKMKVLEVHKKFQMEQETIKNRLWNK